MALNLPQDVGMAAIVLGCSFGFAQAAAPRPPPAPPDPSELASLQNQSVEACEHTGEAPAISYTFAFDSVWINYP
jgi:hypothetical protein